MANAARGIVDVVIGGTVHVLAYDSNALAELEEYFGKSIQKLFTGFGDDLPTFYVIRALLWAGLKQRKHKMTVEDAGRLMRSDDPAEMKGYFEAAMRGVMGALGQDWDAMQARQKAGDGPLPEKKPDWTIPGTPSPSGSSETSPSQPA